MKLRHLVQAPLLADDSLDVPGILWLEHLNIIVGPREEANTFFCDFLGCVPQPGRSWHVNLGSQQFHLGNGGEPHVLTGSVSLALPSLQALRGRVAAASSALSHTRFAVDDHGDHVAVTCPWGSQYLCWDAALPPVVEAERSADAPALPKMVAVHVGLDESCAVRAAGQPGIRCVEFRVRPGTAARIGRFYRELFGCRVSDADGCSTVLVGPSVHLVFHEVAGLPLTDDEEAAQAGPGGGEGLHVCVYIERFKQTFDALSAHGLVGTNPRFARLDKCDTYEEAAASRTLRFKHIIDLETKEVLLEVEHEVRAQRHFQFFKQVHYPEGSGM